MARKGGARGVWILKCEFSVLLVCGEVGSSGCKLGGVGAVLHRSADCRAEGGGVVCVAKRTCSEKPRSQAQDDPTLKPVFPSTVSCFARNS